MPGPGFTSPDLCSIRAAAEQEAPAEAVRGGCSADGYPRGNDELPAPLTSGIDCAIRLSTAVAVLAVAGIAAYVSYWHAYAVVRAHGETGITARLEPATIDGLVYASSMVVPYAARHQVRVPSLARWLLGLGIAATLRRTWPRAGLTAWSGRWSRPGRRSASSAPTNELLVWLIRTAGAAGRGPSGGHLGTGTACRAAARPVPASAVDGDRPGGSGRDTSGSAWRPSGPDTGHSSIPASGERDGEVRGAGAGNAAAVAAYRVRAAARDARLAAIGAAAEADAADGHGHHEHASRQRDLAASYQAMHDAYRERETVFAAVMADRADWDTATRHRRHLAVAADAELRRRHPGQHYPPLRSAEPDPATENQRAELTLTPGEQIRDMGQWIKDLAAQRRAFADRLAERQSLTIPAADPDYADLGPAFPAWTGSRGDAILQPPKPEIRPSMLVLDRVADRDADWEAAD